ncbi:MAG: transposase [Proteobacteria bacterium]|nr:transposase [Pseudomonadota bacterium]
MEQLIANGSGDLGVVFASRFDLAMRIERERFLGAEHHERTLTRRGYANGTKPKRIDTPAGSLTVNLPKTAGHDEPFYPQSLERGRRSTRAVLLDEELAAWRNRPLGKIRYLIVDARYEKMRLGGMVRDAAVLSAMGVGPDGRRRAKSNGRPSIFLSAPVWRPSPRSRRVAAIARHPGRVLPWRARRLTSHQGQQRQCQKDRGNAPPVLLAPLHYIQFDGAHRKLPAMSTQRPLRDAVECQLAGKRNAATRSRSRSSESPPMGIENADPSPFESLKFQRVIWYARPGSNRGPTD